MSSFFLHIIDFFVPTRSDLQVFSMPKGDDTVTDYSTRAVIFHAESPLHGPVSPLLANRPLAQVQPRRQIS